MATVHQLMTAADLEHLPRAGRHRLIKGVLQVMSPGGDDHGRYIIHLTAPLAMVVLGQRLGALYAAETGFRLAHDPDTVQAADLAFVRRERVRPLGPKPAGQAYFDGAPDLAVEVISPNDTYTEVEDTVATWLVHGTRVVVVVDPRRRALSVYRPTGTAGRIDVQTLTAADRLTLPELFGDWSLPLAAIFTEEPGL